MNHIEVLKNFSLELERKPDPLTLLVFGSVAKRTHHAGSDIDSIVIYRKYPESFKFETTGFQGIQIGISNWDFDYYRDNIINKPFTKYILITSQVVFDKTSKVQSWIDAIKRYFETNPDIQAEWSRLNASYEAEKRKYGSGRTNIFDVYEELEQKFKGRILQETID